MNLTNRTVVVTGASSGIGRQCAIDLSNAGANVILLGRDKNRLSATFDSLRPGNHLSFQLDITEYDKIEPVIDETVSKIGNIDGFLSCAGIESTIPLKTMRPKIYIDHFMINVISGFELARIISKNKYICKNGASFVFVSSIMSLLGEKGKVAYCSSKSALTSGIKAMALELAPKKIRANCISPAVVETEMTKKMLETLPESFRNEIINKHPLGIGKPLDISNLVCFLISDLSTWITGSNIIIDGGYSSL